MSSYLSIPLEDRHVRPGLTPWATLSRPRGSGVRVCALSQSRFLVRAERWSGPTMSRGQGRVLDQASVSPDSKSSTKRVSAARPGMLTP